MPAGSRANRAPPRAHQLNTVLRVKVAPSSLQGSLTSCTQLCQPSSTLAALCKAGSSVRPHSGAAALGDVGVLLTMQANRRVAPRQLASDTALLPAGKSANSMLPHPDADAELEGVVDELREGSVEARSAAAEKLFNMCAEDEGARQRTGSLGVVQPLVRTPTAVVALLCQYQEPACR